MNSDPGEVNSQNGDNEEMKDQTMDSDNDVDQRRGRGRPRKGTDVKASP